MAHTALHEALVLLAASVALVAAFRRLHLPPILGYLAVGVVAGPHALGLVPDSQTVRFLAEIGVVFLLFTIGLELSMAQFLAMKRAVLGLGGSQVMLTALAAGALAYWSGITWEGALVIGGAVAMSSTAISVKQLTEQLEMHSRHGRLALVVLLFQDLAVVPFLVVIPILGGDGDGGLALPLLWALVKGAAAFAVMFAAGHWLLRPLFHAVAAARSAELFTLTALLVALAAAATTEMLGLSLALGAFLAGILLGETEYRHQVETDIRPFRDVLMGLFFVSVGLQLDLSVLPATWHWVLALTLALVLGKGLLIAVLTRLGGHENGVALRTGLVLAQGGEFGFALLALGLSRDLLFPDDAQPLLAAIVFSMVLAPFLIRYNGPLAKQVFCGSYLRARTLHAEDVEAATREVTGHVLLAGFGRIGQNLATFLRQEGFEYVALDLDPVVVREAYEAGERVLYGDATHGELLEAAGLERARAVVITFDDAHGAQRILSAVRTRRQDLPVIVRTRDDSHLEELESAGADVVLPETLEASMMLATQVLQHLGLPTEQVLERVTRAREGHYRGLRGFFHGAAIESIEDAERYREHLHTVVLPETAHAVDHQLAAMDLEAVGVEVDAVCRSGIRGEAPEPDMQLRPGDAVVLKGPIEGIVHAEQRLLSG